MTRFMKRVTMLLMAFVLLLSCMIMPVSAAETMDDFFPNKNITLSGDPLFVYTGDESSGLIEMCIATPNELLEIGSYYGPAFDNMFGTDGMCLMGMQIDYRINGGPWHYTESWDKLNQDNMAGSVVRYHLNMNALFGPDASYVADIISSSTEAEDYGDVAPLFTPNGSLDIENNKIEFRTRAYVYYKLQNGKEHYIFSDWSKDLGPGETPATDEKHIFEAPKISHIDVNATEENMNFSIKIAVNENIINELMQYKAIYGQASEFVLEAKIMPVNEDGSFKEDEAIALTNLSTNASINEGYHLEETLKYEFAHNASFDRYDKWAIIVRFVGGEQFESEYSEPELISILAEENPSKDNEGNLIKDDTKTEEKCSLCGFCSMPLGICIFTYIIAAVILLVLIAVVAFVIRKKRNENFY